MNTPFILKDFGISSYIDFDVTATVDTIQKTASVRMCIFLFMLPSHSIHVAQPSYSCCPAIPIHVAPKDGALRANFHLV